MLENHLVKLVQLLEERFRNVLPVQEPNLVILSHAYIRYRTSHDIPLDLDVIPLEVHYRESVSLVVLRHHGKGLLVSFYAVLRESPARPVIIPVVRHRAVIEPVRGIRNEAEPLELEDFLEKVYHVTDPRLVPFQRVLVLVIPNSQPVRDGVPFLVVIVE